MSTRKGPAVPTREELESVLPKEVVHAICDGVIGKSTDIGPRRFLAFVAQSDHQAAVPLRKFLTGDRESYGEPHAAQALLGAIEAWTAESRALELWQNYTIEANRKALVEGLIHAAGNDDVRLPLISHRSLSAVPRNSAQHAKLGDLQWPEFDGVPESQRDALAIKLLNAQIIEVFGQHEALFLRGQELLGDHGLKLRRRQRELEALQRLVETERNTWAKKGHSIFARSWSDKLLRSVSSIRHPDFWRDLGLPTPRVTEQDGLGHLTTVASLVTSCVGPNPEAGTMVQGLTATSIGWNRQPIQSMVRNPYLYRSASEVRLGSERMLAAMKVRAGHIVVGSDDNAVARGLHLVNLNALFSDLSSDPDFSSAEDFATVDRESDLCSVMARYSAMTSAITEFLPSDASNFFFLAISSSNQSKGFKPVGQLRTPAVGGPLSRIGTTFSAVRKSHLFLLGRSGLETEEVRARAGQFRPGSLELHYRTDSFSLAEREEAVRLFSECIQAITLDGKIAFKIGLPKEQHDWFVNVAALSGISSACGIGVNIDESATATDFIFIPNDEGLLELYFAHRALKLAEREVGQLRWTIQGLRLMAMVLAIGRSLFKKGLRSGYQRAVRKGLRLLATGGVVLPAVLEA